MCGIAGIVDWSGRPPDARILRAMTDRLHHRGPDGEGHYFFENVALGHRRLSIIDVTAGKQPMSNEDRTVWVTFNGEIYNFQELRADLRRSGHVFRTQSDTEVIVHGYEQCGDSVVDTLRGMFALALIDQRSGRGLLARDHFGIKPLVYYVTRDRLVFASEIKAILADPEIRPELDLDSITDYFEYGYVPAPKSILQKVHKLLPGHIVSFSIRSAQPVRQTRYWHLNYAGPVSTATEPESAEAVRELLRESVHSQMVSDVPLGAMLSGGIDSSAIVALMTSASTASVRTFSIGFEDERFSETRFARLVADANRTEHHEQVVTADLQSLLPRLVRQFDEPFADASAIPTYYVCAMARQHVTVCLSGDGGDELFAGYDRYRQCMSLGKFDFLPTGLKSAVFGPLSKIYRRGPGSTFLRGSLLDRDERFIDYMRNQYGALDVSRIVDESIRGRFAQHASYDYLRHSISNDNPDTLHRYLEADAATYLPGDILTKVDATSMMNSLEVRVPFLDHRFAEFVAALPSHYKLRHGVSKYLLKEAMAGSLPEAVLHRRKMGFGVPMRHWVVTQLRDIVHSYLLDKTRVSGLLDAKLLRTMVNDNEAKVYKSPYGGKLWWVLAFEMWYQDVYRSNAN